MKFSEKWLREWVNPELSTEELVEQLTMGGLEVDGVEQVAGEFSGVIVGEIVGCEQHPDADKLRVCQVSDGSEQFQVVCGAPNARVGIKIPFATVGAKLPGDFKIKKAKLRGVESFGMLCAEQELGMAESSDGLMELPLDAPVGDSVRDYLQLDDAIIEVDLTPNRADCFSIAGIARDVGVLNKQDVIEPAIEPVAAVIDDILPVEIDAQQDCGRYVGRVIRGIDVAKPSPLWMQEKLRRSGIRSIDAVVDVTNYVLLELGQPMHAFDLNKLNGGIKVRLAERGEKLTLLDDQDIELQQGSMVIADHQAPVALAGIMGGQASAVTAATQDIFLESAFFAPVRIAGRARSYGLHTDSSMRFERGVDYELQRKAIERATQLLLDIVGGQPGPVIEVVAESLPKAPEVELRAARIEKVLGLTMGNAEVSELLQRLGLDISETAEGWKALSPSWRFDIAIEADLLEEMARIYGYNRLPVTQITANLSLRAKPEAKVGLRSVRRQLMARGYQEAITYSFVDPRQQQLVCPDSDAVALANPISADMAVMRTSLWTGLLGAVKHNLNRQQSRVRLFESGLSFVPGEDGLQQQPMLAGVVAGRREPESWSENAETVDYYDLKGDLESVLGLAADLSQYSFQPSSHPALHPGQSAEISRNGKLVGRLGAIHPQLQKKLGLSQTVYLFEVALSAITEASLPEFAELSKFPEVRRDLAIVIDCDIPAQTVLEAVKKQAGEHFRNLRLFDTYQGEGIDPKRKSLAFGLTFQHSSRTLNEEEINAAIDQVVATLESDFAATLRN